MKNIKELFNNARIRVKESKAVVSMKGFFSKVNNNKFMNSVKSKTEGIKGFFKGFTDGTNNTVKDSMSGEVVNRFSSKFKKFFKNTTKNIQNKANDGSKFAKFMTVTIKVLSIIATIAFICLVIYCIKDVFMYCLMLVATCAAVAICIEFILSVLSVATGCKI